MKNFEKFQTAEERAKAFGKYCRNNTGKCYIRQNCNICIFAWLDLEADDDEEEKPLPCPFCGASAYVNEGENGWCEKFFSVNCSCGYRTKENYRSRESAISAHNRVARAVIAEIAKDPEGGVS